MTELLTIGDIKIHWLQGGNFLLDGGTMFGPVPKSLWQKRYAPDEDNLIPLCNDPILVQTHEKNILIDSGLGNKLSEKQQRIFRVSPPWNIPKQLEQLGLSRSDIDIVILTHCDFDHAGGIIMIGENGDEELTWPKAVHIIQQDEWEDVENPCRRALSTYLPNNFAKLKTDGDIQLINGDQSICDGVAVRKSGGHTRGHQIVEIFDQEASAVHLGDLFPTHAQLNPLWVMAYDNFPLEVIDRKEQYFQQYSQKDSWFLFYHDPFMRACKLGDDLTISSTWPETGKSTS